MKNIIIISIAIFASISCSRNDKNINMLWEKAEQLREDEDLKASIEKLIEIKTSYPDHPKAAEAQFMLSEIYLNDVKDYQIAIDGFKNVVEKYPKSDDSEKALFMIGYIYANYLDAYSDGIFYYHKFKDTYPESELIQSVDYELNNLTEIQNKIAQLNEQAIENTEGMQ